ncbi:hypothetical protein HYALB_00008110 [Hymenoscyphus albidus]|uniref:Uncharacterized protein n=1 Tax=Hymenoscyphus albidus TaxID=595503 RepID=A0A9N9Q1N3_9HELO|nr:hypothetical protein HYALB_00008110 [Hymenoscyphus albidus]
MQTLLWHVPNGTCTYKFLVYGPLAPCTCHPRFWQMLQGGTEDHDLAGLPDDTKKEQYLQLVLAPLIPTSTPNFNSKLTWEEPLPTSICSNDPGPPRAQEVRSFGELAQGSISRTGGVRLASEASMEACCR